MQSIASPVTTIAREGQCTQRTGATTATAAAVDATIKSGGQMVAKKKQFADTKASATKRISPRFSILGNRMLAILAVASG